LIFLNKTNCNIATTKRLLRLFKTSERIFLDNIEIKTSSALVRIFQPDDTV